MVAGRCRFQEWVLEKGWGDTAETCRETLNFLSEVLQAPDPINMEKFFSRVPSVFNIVIFSIHGSHEETRLDRAPLHFEGPLTRSHGRHGHHRGVG